MKMFLSLQIARVCIFNPANYYPAHFYTGSAQLLHPLGCAADI